MKKYMIIILMLFCASIVVAEPNPGHYCDDINISATHPCQGLYVVDPSSPGTNFVQFPYTYSSEDYFLVSPNLRTIYDVVAWFGDLNAPAGNLNVGNSVYYGGRLSKLDVAQTPSATIRVNDLLIGGSGTAGRRATPGRALVDFTSDTLYLNYVDAGIPDWSNMIIGGDYVQIQSGKLGVGMTPVKNLDVAGEIGASDDICTDLSGGKCLSDVVTSSVGGTANHVAKFNAGGNDIEDSVIYDDGTNIGIGTTTPSTLIHLVSGNPMITLEDLNNDGGRPGISFIGNDLNFIESDDTANEVFGFYSTFGNNRNNDAIIRVFGKASGTWGKNTYITHDGTAGKIGTDSGSLLLMSQTGKVGIGMNPSEELDVAGNIRASGTICDSVGCIGGGGSGTIDGSGAANYVPKFQDADTLTNSLIFENGANVGIGTATPTEELDVTGDISASGDLVTGNDVVVGNNLYTGGVIRSATGGDVIIVLG